MNNFTGKIISKILPPLISSVLLIGLWQLLSVTNVMPSYMMPSPYKVFNAFIDDFDILCFHGLTTVCEALGGLFIGIAFSFIIAIIMDACKPIRDGIYPLLVISQTIPSIAIAPLLLLWFGYGILPKIILIVITTFFPITISLLDGFATADKDTLNLLKSMGANSFQQFIHVKLPNAISHFFAGLKISVSYAVVSAVISEWLGGTQGLGVYMTRVRKSFAYDKMFAVIFFIALVSLLLIGLVSVIKWLCMPWERRSEPQKYRKGN